MTTLFDLKSTYRLSLRQQRWVVESALGHARRAGHTPSVRALQEAREVILDAIDTERAWETERAQQPDSRDAVDVDRKIDRRVSTIYRTLEARAALGRDHTEGRQAADLLTRAFPRGLVGHTNVPLVEATHLHETLVDIITAPPWKPLAEALNLTPLTEEVTTLNAELRQILDPEVTVSTDEKKRARLDGEEALLRALFFVAGSFDPRAPEQIAVRDEILVPVHAMNAQLARLYRRRNTGRSDALAAGSETAAPDVTVEATPEPATPPTADAPLPCDEATTEAPVADMDAPFAEPDAANTPTDTTIAAK